MTPRERGSTGRWSTGALDADRLNDPDGPDELNNYISMVYRTFAMGHHEFDVQIGD
ncbi:MAG: hypothetical protein ACOCV2_05715 [Persicimonas sp.]